MDVRCIILDFDGTFTDVDQEAGPFLDAYRTAVASVIGGDVASDWSRLESVVHADPTRYGWEYEGKIVAPANADPYLRATVVTNLLLDQYDILPDPKDRSELLQRLYRENYPKAESVFRSDAKAVIERLIASNLPVFVVTNSETAAVNQKLDKLGPKGRERLQVRGDAKKFFVIDPTAADEQFARLPETEQLEGLPRPLYLRRGHYFDALHDIWKQTGTAPHTTFLVGDIYELDLAMPAHLGVNIHLLVRATTPAYECDAVKAHGGTVSESLAAVLQRLRL